MFSLKTTLSESDKNTRKKTQLSFSLLGATMIIVHPNL